MPKGASEDQRVGLSTCSLRCSITDLYPDLSLASFFNSAIKEIILGTNLSCSLGALFFCKYCLFETVNVYYGLHDLFPPARALIPRPV